MKFFLFLIALAALALFAAPASAMYHPGVGQFLQRDPLNQNQPGGGYHDGMNRYTAYFIERLDPLGLNVVILSSLPESFSKPNPSLFTDEARGRLKDAIWAYVLFYWGHTKEEHDAMRIDYRVSGQRGTENWEQGAEFVLGPKALDMIGISPSEGAGSISRDDIRDPDVFTKKWRERDSRGASGSITVSVEYLECSCEVSHVKDPSKPESGETETVNPEKGIIPNRVRYPDFPATVSFAALCGAGEHVHVVDSGSAKRAWRHGTGEFKLGPFKNGDQE